MANTYANQATVKPAANGQAGVCDRRSYPGKAAAGTDDEAAVDWRIRRVLGGAAIVDFAMHYRGAIGYIGKTTEHEGVKVLSIK